MKSLPLIPFGITLLAISLVALRRPAHAPDIELACTIAGALAIAAAGAIVLARRATLATLLQVALGATVGQMLLTAFAALIVWLSGLVASFQSFAIALLVFYWVHLAVLSIVAIRVIRQACARCQPFGECFMTMMMPIIAAMDPLDEVLPHVIKKIGPLAVTNHMVMAAIAAILMLLIFPRLFSRVESGPPTGARNFFESMLEFLRVEVFRPALKEHTDRFVPFLWSLFFFILFCNLLGTIPLAAIVALITRGRIEHLGGPATGNISTTAALAAAAFVFIHVNGITQVVRDLMNGTYGHHGHHEEHTSNGDRGHEAALDLDHMRGEALPADVPSDFRAIGSPIEHYNDDINLRHKLHLPAGESPHAPRKSLPAALAMAIPLYIWNFAPHPFRPEPARPA